jgi:WD40 repeat protein/transcriptional regulator with XRE-family HTH domain
MLTSIPISTLEKFTTFGDLLRYLRRRAGITQLELSIAVGYSTAQICRLEQNLRLPDPPTIEARFVPALYLEDEPKAVARLLELAANVRREDAPEPGLSPYKGLEYFDEADAGLFVGREALSAKLAERVLSLASRKEINEKRFFAIVGASGSGKSSLVRAGLVPALRWNKRSANWQIHVLTPTAHPLESLATALSQDISVASTATMMDDLRQDERSLGLHIKRELKTTGASQLLLVIDQFEELFTLCYAEEERSAFIDNLLKVSYEDDGHAIIVITLRADFYAHCASYPLLRQALARQQEYIGVMSDEEMQRAIEEPARRGRWEFEPGLVDLILHDVGHEPGALPLLSHALLETWQRRHGRTLTLSGYTSAGGVRGAIAETAEAVFTDQFSHAQQTIARRIFLRLTELGDETATGDTRRRASFNELILKPEERDATQAVLNALVDARLITTSEDSVQVAHEALIREWPTLRGWLEDNREGLRLQRQLTEAAQEWLAAERESDILFRGARLVQAREWAAAHGDDLNVLEREFLVASVGSSEREAAEREATQLRELEGAQKLAEAERQRAEAERQRAEVQIKTSRRLRLRAFVITGIGALAVILAVLAFFAWQRSLSQAAQNRSLSLASSAQLANEAGKSDAALALALEAVKSNQPPSDAIAALRKVAISPGTRFMLNGHSHEVRAVAISPDNHMALSGSCANLDAQGSCLQGELILWDLDARKELRRWTAHADWVNAVAFSQDGQILISGDPDGNVILWDVISGNEIRQLPRMAGGIIALVVTTAVDASSQDLVTGSTDGAFTLWNLATGAPLQHYEGYTNTLTSMSVAYKSPFAVTGYADGSMFLWNLNNPQPIRKIEVSGERVDGVVISADGSFIISAQGLSLIKIDSQSGKMVEQYSTGHTWGQVLISPDDKFVFSPGTGILQWNIAGWRQQNDFVDADATTAFSISQDGRMGISGDLNSTLRVWNLNEALDYQTFKTGLSSPDSLAVSPDGQTLLLGNIITDTQIPILWDIAGSRIVRTFQGFNTSTSPDSVAFSLDGRYIAAAGGGVFTGVPGLMVWHLDSGEIACHLESYQAILRSLAFSPDSHFLLAGSQATGDQVGGQELILWDVLSCQLVRRFEMNENEDVTGIAFSSDGKWAATGTAYNKRIILWEVSTGREIRRFSYQDYQYFFPIFDVVFGPGDRTILAPGPDGLYLWDVQTGERIRRFYGHTAYVWSVDISPDGKYVLSSSDNGEVFLWDFSTGELLYRLPAHTQPVISARFSPDGKFAYSISTDGVLTKWKVPVQQTLPELLDWIQANRFVRPLTCEEKDRYRVEPLCQRVNP